MSKIAPYLRKLMYLLSLLVVVPLVVVLKRNHNRQICTDVQILIDAPIEKQLITKKRIQDNLNSWYQEGLSGVENQDIDLADIEDQLESLAPVYNAEVSFDLRGVLKIQIDQEIPVVRIIQSTGKSFYISKRNVQIPVSESDVARVPIANGRFSKAMITKVYTLSTYVYENEFMEALTEQIFVDDNSDLVIVPKIKNQRIIVGDTTDVPAKFEKLIDFYKHGLNHIGWDKYRIVNLKYKDQIVCN